MFADLVWINLICKHTSLFVCLFVFQIYFLPLPHPDIEWGTEISQYSRKNQESSGTRSNQEPEMVFPSAALLHVLVSAWTGTSWVLRCGSGLSHSIHSIPATATPLRLFWCLNNTYPSLNMFGFHLGLICTVINAEIYNAGHYIWTSSLKVWSFTLNLICMCSLISTLMWNSIFNWFYSVLPQKITNGFTSKF